MSEKTSPVVKDRLLGEAFDLTEARIAALAKAIWKSTDPHDFVQLAVGAIHRQHHTARRSEAIAALVGCSPKTGDRINKCETQHAETWPLQLAGILEFLTLSGVIAYVCAATGMDENEAEALIRRHLGSERARG